jgi:predicted nucleotidyltransferase
LVENISDVLRLYPVRRSALFGSYARNEQTDDSDIDLLLDLGVDERHPYVDYVYELVDALETKLKLRVDFVTVNGLRASCSNAFKKSVQAESRWFYEV